VWRLWWWEEEAGAAFKCAWFPVGSSSKYKWGSWFFEKCEFAISASSPFSVPLDTVCDYRGCESVSENALPRPENIRLGHESKEEHDTEGVNQDLPSKMRKNNVVGEIIMKMKMKMKKKVSLQK